MSEVLAWSLNIYSKLCCLFHNKDIIGLIRMLGEKCSTNCSFEEVTRMEWLECMAGVCLTLYSNQ